MDMFLFKHTLPFFLAILLATIELDTEFRFNVAEQMHHYVV